MIESQFNCQLSTVNCQLNRGSSSVDRALAFQAEGRGFESRLPLLMKESTIWFVTKFILRYCREVSSSGSKACKNLQNREGSRLLIGELRSFRLCSSVVEHFLGKEEVAGSIPAIGSKQIDQRISRKGYCPVSCVLLFIVMHI